MESMFDLRQGFLTTRIKLMKDLNDFILSPEYNHRVIDDLMGIPAKEYRKEIEAGNMELLKGSIVTYIVTEIHNRVALMSKYNIMEGSNTIPEVWLNAGNFPIEGELLSQIKNLMFISFGKCCHVDVVKIDTKDLTPTFIHENNIRIMWQYNATEWLKIHQESLNNFPIKDVELYFAPIYDVYDENAIEKIKEVGFNDGFTYLEMELAKSVKARFNPIVFYSNNIISLAIQKTMFDELEEETKKFSEEHGDQYDDIADEVFGDELKEDNDGSTS